VSTPRVMPLDEDPGGSIRLRYDGRPGAEQAAIRQGKAWVPIPELDAHRIVAERREAWGGTGPIAQAHRKMADEMGQEEPA